MRIKYLRIEYDFLWYTYPRFGFERYSIYSTRDGKHKKASNIYVKSPGNDIYYASIDKIVDVFNKLS